MQNSLPYLGYYPQYWILPNGMITPSPFFPQVPIYPQMERVQARTIPTNPQLNKSIAVQPMEFSSVALQKQVREKPKSKREHEKIIVILDSVSSNEVKIITDIKKAQRPQKYLTQKAYYMKQKLKGKQKGETRILRRRFKEKQKKRQSAVCRIKNRKKQVKAPKMKQKTIPTVKDYEKQKKISDKIQLKLCHQYHQYRDDFAQIPNRISGVAQLNEFCRLKTLSLQSRRLKGF